MASLMRGLDGCRGLTSGGNCLRKTQIIAGAAVLIAALGSASVQAAGNADVYNFFISEKAKVVASGVVDASPKATLEEGAASKRGKMSKARSMRRGKAGRGLLRNIAPAQLAAVDVEALTDPTGRKALGYDTPSRERYRGLIAKYATENGLPFALGDAVVRVESRYRPHVTNGGAVGLMQIKPSTARGLGYRGDAKGLMHPETNIKYGMKYLGQAYRLANGDTCGTVMRYQSGHYAKRINRANLAYCAKVRTIAAGLGTDVALVSGQ